MDVVVFNTLDIELMSVWFSELSACDDAATTLEIEASANNARDVST
jgi:hypothetical protein